MIQDMKEHEPELEKLNKEVTKHRKVKEKNSQVKTNLRGTPRK